MHRTGGVILMSNRCRNHDWLNDPIKLVKVDLGDIEINVIEITAFYYVGKKAQLTKENKKALLDSIHSKVKVLYGPKEFIYKKKANG